MNVDTLMKQINIEEIYKTILDLEGPKYPLDNMDDLNEAGDYIFNKLKSYGIKTTVQEFYVKGIEEPFRNIVGWIGDESKPAIVLGSHYDTVRDCPGANDNFSSVAVSLEVARVISKMDNPPTVIIAVFTLEEAHPGFNKILEQRLFENGIYDSLHRPTSASLLKFRKMIGKLVRKKQSHSKNNVIDILRDILIDLRASMQVDEIKYIEILIKLYDEFKPEYTNGNLLYSIGSQEFVKTAQKDNTKIDYIINFDCLGWMFEQEGTQNILPIGKELEPFVTLHKTSLTSTKGNFIGIMGEKNSKPILDEFIKHCQSPDVDIPFFGINIPLEYDDIKKVMTDTLRSDHAPFWQAGIPGIFISDTANFRSNYYHTGADTSNRLDYDTLAKISIATLKTLLTFKK